MANRYTGYVINDHYEIYFRYFSHQYRVQRALLSEWGTNQKQKICNRFYSSGFQPNRPSTKLNKR